MSRALITGITGQDGLYLGEFLAAMGYEVFEWPAASPTRKSPWSRSASRRSSCSKGIWAICLHEAYATQHVARLASAARVMIWQVVSACYRIALAAETGVLRGHIVTQNLTFAVRDGLSPTES